MSKSLRILSLGFFSTLRTKNPPGSNLKSITSLSLSLGAICTPYCIYPHLTSYIEFPACKVQGINRRPGNQEKILTWIKILSYFIENCAKISWIYITRYHYHTLRKKEWPYPPERKHSFNPVFWIPLVN